MLAPLGLVLALMLDLTVNPGVRRAMWELLADARYGFGETEEAMFIVYGRDGRLTFIRWTSMKLPHQSHWTGTIPLGTIAIAHTHPNWIPQPSKVDRRTARESGLAVYVVTRTQIVKATGAGVQTVVQGDWKPRRPR